MKRIDVDPGILAFPAALSPDMIAARVTALASWSEFHSENRWLSLCLSTAARQRLRESGFLPAHEPVSIAMKNSGVQQYSTADVIRMVYSIRESSSSAAHCCISDELHSEFTSQPSQPWHAPSTLDGLTENALVLSHIERTLHADERFRRFLSFLNADALHFKFSLDMIEPDGLQGFSPTELPRMSGDSVVVVSDVEQLLTTLEAEYIWEHATGAADLKLAIRLKCREKLLSIRQYETFQKIPLFFVGGEFFQSLGGRECDRGNRYAAQTLDSCAAAVLGLPTLEIKPFDKKPRNADKASPLRAHISKSGAAMRLMMWQRPPRDGQNCIELANVGRKWEEEISYADPSHAV